MNKNSIIDMILIKAGSFIMGSEDKDFIEETPSHIVNITTDFKISRTPVTLEQYQLFRAEHDISCNGNKYVTGISWNDANDFCKWLSEKDGKKYRLPTEAEWEYSFKPLQDKSLVCCIELGLLEWCNDWYSDYSDKETDDPFGATNSHAKVIRGGSPDEENPKWGLNYTGVTRRAAAAADFGHSAKDINNTFGCHNICFRVVCSVTNTGLFEREIRPFACVGIKQANEHVNTSQSIDLPYFRARPLLPIPPDNSTREEIDAAGLNPALRGHNHSPAFEVCSNGDLLHITYSSYREYEPGTHLIASRLRFGTDNWDMPDLFYDFPNINDHSPLLWNDNGVLWFFWGNPRLKNSYPFNYMKSYDNGETWGKICYPFFANKVGEHTAQPINSAFRASDGSIYLSSDAIGASSVIWRSLDNGDTWYDTSGRTAGRHSAFVQLADGSILSMGGKNSNIDGYMPRSVSYDHGSTWATEASIFPALTNSQRPSILRLRSGRLFFAGDYQNKMGEKPISIKENGSYVALSDDEGRSWIIKKLSGALLHEEPEYMGGHSTIGYSVARQGPNGMIHLITSMNDPCMHFEFNEAWILHGPGQYTYESQNTGKIQNTKVYAEYYPDGSIKLEYSGVIADNGRFLLDGIESWYYPDGNIQRKSIYHLGKKTGTEEYYSEDCKKLWCWEYFDEASSVCKTFHSSGKIKSIVNWSNFRAKGRALLLSKEGNVISDKVFKNGRLNPV